MSTELTFRSAIDAARSRCDLDDLHYQQLVYADWLDNQGRSEDASNIRAEVEAFAAELASDFPEVAAAGGSIATEEAVRQRVFRKTSSWPSPDELPGLDEHQREALGKALCRPLGILTGTPGVGKTFITAALVIHLCERFGESNIGVCGPTGKSAVRCRQSIETYLQSHHRDVQTPTPRTIHSLLGIGRNGHDGRGWGFEYNRRNSLPYKYVIIDEASMLSCSLANSLLAACADQAHVLLVGDTGQLPPVGHGSPLRDMIEAGVPHGELTQIRRNAGLIVRACAAMRRGDDYQPAAKFDAASGDNWRHIEVANPANIVPTIKALLAAWKSSKRWNPLSDVQVLCALNDKGPACRQILNTELQELLNPTERSEWASIDGELSSSAVTGPRFRTGDKAICLKNGWYVAGDDGNTTETVYVANGEQGIVLDGQRAQTLIAFGDRAIMVRPSDWGEFDLGYAITAHKCVHPDTLVETAEGLLPIRLISTLSGIIATPTGAREYKNFVSNPQGPALILTTKNGYSVTVTPDHKIESWDGHAWSMREASQVSTGDWVRVRLGTTVDSQSLAELPGLPNGDVRAAEWKTPSVVTHDVAEFLGLMVGDGTVFPKGFRLVKRHRDVAERFGKLCSSLFGREPHPCRCPGATGFEVSSTRLSAWLDSIGGLSANAKAIPECILRSPVSIQNSFLRGLFEDGGVGVTDEGAKHVEWSTIYEAMSAVVQVMLLRSGIPSSRAKYGNDWRITIYGDAIDTFAEKIGFIASFKNERLKKRCYANDRGKNIPVDTDVVRSARKQVVDAIGISGYQNALFLKYVSVKVAKSISGIIGYDQNYYCDRIKSIIPTACPSMCVEVSDGHRFLQNGFPHGNSQGSQWPVVVIGIDRHAHRVCSREWWYTALSRASELVITVGRLGLLRQQAGRPALALRKTFLKQLIEEGMANVI